LKADESEVLLMRFTHCLLVFLLSVLCSAELVTDLEAEQAPERFDRLSMSREARSLP
jgi:hypothetical protein